MGRTAGELHQGVKGALIHHLDTEYIKELITVKTCKSPEGAAIRYAWACGDVGPGDVGLGDTVTARPRVTGRPGVT